MYERHDMFEDYGNPDTTARLQVPGFPEGFFAIGLFGDGKWRVGSQGPRSDQYYIHGEPKSDLGDLTGEATRVAQMSIEALQRDRQLIPKVK